MRRSAIDPDYAHLLAAGEAQHKEEEDSEEERLALASDAQEEKRQEAKAKRHSLGRRLERGIDTT